MPKINRLAAVVALFGAFLPSHSLATQPPSQTRILDQDVRCVAQLIPNEYWYEYSLMTTERHPVSPEIRRNIHSALARCGLSTSLSERYLTQVIELVTLKTALAWWTEEITTSGHSVRFIESWYNAQPARTRLALARNQETRRRVATDLYDSQRVPTSTSLMRPETIDGYLLAKSRIENILSESTATSRRP